MEQEMRNKVNSEVTYRVTGTSVVMADLRFKAERVQ